MCAVSSTSTKNQKRKKYVSPVPCPLSPVTGRIEATEHDVHHSVIDVLDTFTEALPKVLVDLKGGQALTTYRHGWFQVSTKRFQVSNCKYTFHVVPFNGRRVDSRISVHTTILEINS